MVAALFLFANTGFRDLVVLTRDKIRFEKNLIKLRAENESLTHQWTRIQTDPTYTDYLIRKTLGYVKKGEVEYQLLTTPGKNQAQ